MTWSEAKQRRSNVDWAAIVPGPVARSQIAWERRHTALAMSRAGMKQTEIAELFGLQSERIRQMLFRAGRLDDAVSPVEAYANEGVLSGDEFTNTSSRQRAAVAMMAFVAAA